MAWICLALLQPGDHKELYFILGQSPIDAHIHTYLVASYYIIATAVLGRTDRNKALWPHKQTRRVKCFAHGQNDQYGWSFDSNQQYTDYGRKSNHLRYGCPTKSRALNSGQISSNPWALSLRSFSTPNTRYWTAWPKSWNSTLIMEVLVEL